MIKNRKVVKTGLAALDEKVGGLQARDLVVLAGRPSLGKTALALNISANVARLKDPCQSVALFSLELSRQAVMTRLISNEAKVALKEARAGYFSHTHWSVISGAAARLAKAPLFINDEEYLTPAQIRSRTKRLSKELREKGERLGLIVIDYLQLMRNERGVQVGAQSGKTTGVIRRLKEIAVELDVPVIVAAMLPRHKGKKDERPVFDDLTDPAIREHADIVAFIHREGYYSRRDPVATEMAELIIAKNPHGETGSIALRFAPGLAMFSN